MNHPEGWRRGVTDRWLVSIGAGAALLMMLIPGCKARASHHPGAARGKGFAPDEAQLRKQRSEARLRSEGVPILASLPTIETEAEADFRSTRAVADRLLALTLVAAKAAPDLSGESPSMVRTAIAKAITERKAVTLFTPEEIKFIAADPPSRQDQIRFQWRYDAAWVLAWALRWIEEPLSRPLRNCDVPRLSRIVHDQPDLAARGLRGPAEILDEADLVYRYHWATEEARMNNVAPPAGLDPDVLMERHQALNWLIGYQGQDWDDVTTDT